MGKPYFLVCEYLKVYNDFGYSDKPGELYTKSKINVCECLLFEKDKSCKNRGKCIIAKDADTWKQISKKSFGTIDLMKILSEAAKRNEELAKGLPSIDFKIVEVI